MDIELTFPKECPSCHEENTIRASRKGSVVCTNCGLVLSDHAFTPVRKRLDKGYIESKLKSGMTSEERQKKRKLKRTRGKYSPEERAKFDRERSFKAACSTLQLPSFIIESAKEYLHKVVKTGKTRGIPEEITHAGIIYNTCNKLGFPLGVKEIGEKLSLDYVKIGKISRKFSRELKESITPPTVKGLTLKISSFFLQNHKDIPEEDFHNGLKKLLKLHERNPLLLSGKDPYGSSLALITLSAMRATKKDFSRYDIHSFARDFKVSPEVIRKRIQAIKKAEKAKN